MISQSKFKSNIRLLKEMKTNSKNPHFSNKSEAAIT